MSVPGHWFWPHCSLRGWMQLGRTWWRILAAGPRGMERARTAMGDPHAVHPGAWTASWPRAVPRSNDSNPLGELPRMPSSDYQPASAFGSAAPSCLGIFD